MGKLYSISFLWVLFLAAFFAQVSESVAAPIIRDVYIFSECEKKASIRVRNGVAPYTYTWSYEGNIIQTDANLTESQFSTLEQALPGDYILFVRDSGGNTYTETIRFSGGTSFILNILTAEERECRGETFGRVYGTIQNGIPPFTINFYNTSNVLVRTNVISGRDLDLSGVPAGKYLVEVIDATGCKELTEIEIEDLEPLILTPAAGTGTFPETCAGNGGVTFDASDFVGTVEFRIRRSNGTYVTNWQPVVNGQIRYDQLVAGDYVLEVSDQYRLRICPAELVFNIGNEVLLGVTPTFKPVSCFNGTDGTITLRVNRIFMTFPFPPSSVTVDIIRPNGTTALSGQVINIGTNSGQRTFTGFGAGIHTIIVRHGGVNYPACTLTYTVDVTQPPAPLAANVTPTHVTCFGENDGRARVHRSGGWGGYKYLWSTGQTSREISGLAPGNYSVVVTDSEGCSVTANFTINGPPSAITASTEVLNGLTCTGANNGSARIFNVAGGYGNYTYRWSNGETTATAFNLPAGLNTVTVMDNGGCEREYTVNVPVPASPPVTSTPTSPLCFGGNDGSIRVQIADNSTTFTVRVNGVNQIGNDVTFNNLPAGQYEVLITYGTNCTIIDFVDIVNPLPITINETNLAINHLLCAGDGNGSIMGLTASGGTGALTYQWQRQVMGSFQNIISASNINLLSLSGGTYRLVVRDQNNCTAFRDYVVNEPSPLQATPPVINNVACFGELTGSASFVISGGTAPYSYSLNGGAFTTTSNGSITLSGLGAANGYFVEIRDANNCIIPNLNFDITSLPAITITNPVVTPETCFGQGNGSIGLTIGGGSGNLGIEWYVAGNFSTVIGTTPTLVNRAPGQYTVKVFELSDPTCFIQQTFTIPVTSELTLELDGPPVNIFCFGESTGAINILVAGGTGTYTFAWTGSNGYTSTQEDISSIPAGLYNVRVTDQNGCWKELTDILVSQPPSGITINLLNRVEPKCFDSADGRIEVQLGGGNPPYTISWQKENSSSVFIPIPGTSPTLSNITSGVYKILVSDANGCTSERTINLGGPDQLVATLVSTEDVSCFGRNDGRITINVTGGTGVYFFAWDHGFINQNPTNLSAGTYGVTVTDANGCTVRLENIQINQPAPLEINLISINGPSCAFDDGSIQVDFVGWIPGLSFSRWTNLANNQIIANNTNTITGLTPGFYRVEYNLNGSCTVSQTYSVPGPTSPLKIFTNQQDASCPGETGIIFVSASGGVPAYTYYIESGGIWQVMTNAILSGLSVGVYPVKVIDAAGCEDASTITIDQPNPPVFDAEVERQVSCFGGNDGMIRYSVSGNTTGINVQWFRRTTLGGKTPITIASLNSLTAGIYFMEITYAGGCMVASPDYEITQPDAVVATPVVVQPVCFGDFGSFTLTFGGGSATKNISVTSTNGFSRILNGEANGVLSLIELLPGTYNWTVTDIGCPAVSGSFVINSIIRPQFNITSQDVSCFNANDGIIEILNPQVQGGRTFTVWINNVNQGTQTSFINVAAGNYQIVLMDSQGCLSEPTLVVISQPDRPLELTNVVVTNNNCFGGNSGSVQFQILGGRPQYRAVLTRASGPSQSIFSLNSASTYSFINLIAGNYTLQVWDQADQCIVTQIFTINDPAPLAVSMSQGTILCAGGTTFIELTATGGVQPYTYVWERFNSSTSTWTTLPATGRRLENVVAGQYRYTVREANNCNLVTDIVMVADGDTITLSYSAGNVLCFGETALVNLQAVSSGTSGSFTYFVNGAQIFGNQFPAKAGTYTVYAVDNVRGCRSSDLTIDITQPSAPVSIQSFTSTNLSCFNAGDGTISLALTGGTAPYTITFLGNNYLANDGQVVTFNNLEANIEYSFTAVDANGCTVNIPRRILSQPAPLITNASFTPILCFGGTSTLTLDITGGTRPYAVSWTYSADGTTFAPLPVWTNQTTLTNIPAGFYTYTVSDGGCADVTATVNITQPPAVTISAVAEDVTCFGGNNGSIVFTLAGGAFTNYRIFFEGREITGNTVSGLIAGTYTAFGLSGTCRTPNITVVISQPTSPLNVAVNYLEEVLCHGDVSDIALRITGGTGPYTAFLNGVSFPVNSSGEITFTDVATGTYHLRVVDSRGCEWQQSIDITNPTPVELNLEEIIDITCVGSSDGEIKVNVTGGSGSYTFRWLNHSNILVGTRAHLVGVPAGTYRLFVEDENGCEAEGIYTIADTTPVDFTFTTTDVLCFGTNTGSITVQASGGRPGYTLVIDGIQSTQLTFTGLRARSYMIYVLDANGCASPIKEVIINQPTPLSLVTTSTNVSCFGANNGQAEVNITGGTAPYTIRWSDGNTASTRNGLAPGNYEIVVTDANGCISRRNVIITQPAPLLVTDQVVNVSCFGGNDGNVTLDITGGNGPFNITWRNINTNQQVGVGPSINNLPAGSYRATIIDQLGCSAIRDFVISQPAAPLSAQPIIADVRCAGEGNGIIDLVVTGGTAPYTYSWSSGETTRSINNKSGGTYTVNITDSRGCSFMETYVITEPQPIVVLPTLIQDVSCFGGNDGALSINISGGRSPYQVQWSNGMTGTNLTGLRAGDYTVFVIDANSCFVSQTYTIGQPDAALNLVGRSSVELCRLDDKLALMLTVTGGTAPYTFAWSNGASTQDLIDIVPGNYSVVVTDAKGCMVTGSYVVPPASLPMDLTLDGKFGICTAGERGEIRAAVSGGLAPYSFAWSNGATTSTISNLLPGNYTLVVTDANGCQVSQTVEVSGPSDLRVSLQNIKSVSCFGGNDGSILIAVNGGRAPFRIRWSHGLVDQLFASNLATGIYSVEVEDAVGCVTTAAFNIGQPTILSFNSTVEDSRCAGENKGVISLNVSGGTPPYTYAWSHGSNNRVARNLGPGTYTVVITDRAGCSTGGTFTVDEPDPIVISGFYSEMLSCHGDQNGYIGIDVSGGIQPYKISWLDLPELSDRYRADLPAGSYTVKVEDDNGCVQLRTFEIKQPDPLEVFLYTRFDVNCETREIVGVAWIDIKGGTSAYQVRWNNGVTNSLERTFFADEEISVFVTDANGCMQEAATTVVMPKAFTDAEFMYSIISLGTTGEILIKDPVQFFDKTIGEVVTWEWDFGDGDKSNEQNPIHTFTKAGTYTISLTTFDILGCVSKTQVTVEVVASYRLLIPNAFTPNGDGLNDTFIPKMRGIDDFEMHIFNKWGELIYSTYERESAGWDGRLNGKMSPNGNYVYKIIFRSSDGEKGSKTGVFSLIL
jgi:gliding motility-associated-like protein